MTILWRPDYLLADYPIASRLVDLSALRKLILTLTLILMLMVISYVYLGRAFRRPMYVLLVKQKYISQGVSLSLSLSVRFTKSPV